MHKQLRFVKGNNKIEEAVQLFRALDHKFRARILDLLQESDMTVTDLYIKLSVEQSVVSQHLAILRRVGLLKVEKSGKTRIYSIDAARLALIEDVCDKLYDFEPVNVNV